MNAGGESRTRTSLKLPHVSHKGEGGGYERGSRNGTGQGESERIRYPRRKERRKKGRLAGKKEGFVTIGVGSASI